MTTSKRFPIPPDYKEDYYPSSLPGCIGERECDPIYMQHGCRVRYACEELCNELYPGGKIKKRSGGWV